MSGLTMQFTDELTIVTCWCGINHAVPTQLRNFQMRQHNDGKRDVTMIFCPLGHQHKPAGKTRADELAEQLEHEKNRRARATARADREQAAAQEAERRRIAQKAATTRARKRGKAGVCPVDGCKRHFANLAAHVARKHPDFDPAADTE